MKKIYFEFSLKSISLNKIFLQFTDRSLEKDFAKEYDKEHRLFYSLGIYLAIFGWALILPIIYWIQKKGFIYLGFFGAITLIIILFDLWAIYKKEKFLGRYQLIIGLTNFVTMIVLLYYFFFHFKPLWPFPALITLLTLAMFAVALFRLRTMASFLAIIGYLIFFLVSLFFLKPDLFTTIFCISTIMVFLPPLLVAAYYSERSARIIFLQKKLLVDQKKEVDNLLANILPIPIAERLKKESNRIADGFENVTVMFADLVNFTKMSQEISPQNLVELLDRIFREFDNLAEEFGLEKVKTIGDAYMIAGGIPEPKEGQMHAVLEMALSMQDVMKEKFSKVLIENKLELRVGIASGPAVAGIIGTKKFSYDIWGDCVNTASRMESHGVPGRIQVTNEIRALMKLDFIFEERGIMEIKGKGKMKVWFLNGKK